MLAGGGDSAARASSPAPPPGAPAPLSIDELEAQALASATKAAPVALASVASMLARPEVRFFRENLRCLLERSRPAQNPRTT